MVYEKRGIIAGIALLFLCMTGAAYGDDLDDVRAVFNADMKRFNAKDASAFATDAHDNVVLFGMLSPFAVKGKAAITDMLEGFFADSERVIFTPINPEFRIIGASALAWGHFTNTEVPAIGAARGDPRSIHIHLHKKRWEMAPGWAAFLSTRGGRVKEGLS